MGAGVKVLPGRYKQLEGAVLTGHSILRGLTFIEIVLQLTEEADLKTAAAAALAHFVLEAEGVARGEESEEFAVAFAEVFWEGRDWEPEAVLLPETADSLGIGGTDSEQDFEWAQLLSRYYNPAARQPGEVKFRRRAPH